MTAEVLASVNHIQQTQRSACKEQCSISTMWKFTDFKDLIKIIELLKFEEINQIKTYHLMNWVYI